MQLELSSFVRAGRFYVCAVFHAIEVSEKLVCSHMYTHIKGNKDDMDLCNQGLLYISTVISLWNYIGLTGGKDPFDRIFMCF